MGKFVGFSSSASPAATNRTLADHLYGRDLAVDHRISSAVSGRIQAVWIRPSVRFRAVARWAADACNARVDDLVQVLLAQTASTDLERTILHPRLLALLLLVRCNLEQCSVRRGSDWPRHNTTRSTTVATITVCTCRIRGVGVPARSTYDIRRVPAGDAITQVNDPLVGIAVYHANASQLVSVINCSSGRYCKQYLLSPNLLA